MIKVLEVVNGFGYGGIRACIQNYSTYINKEEFEVHIYVFGAENSPFQSQMEAIGCKLFFDPVNDISSNNIVRFVRKLTTFIRNGKYDVVHAHCNLSSAWITLSAVLAGARVRLSHSHSTSHFSGCFFQNLWSLFRRFIISCTATHKLACGKLAGEAMYGNNANFIILQNGINVNRFLNYDKEKVENLRKQFNIAEGVRVYANVTRMDPPKNHLFAIEVFNEIHKIEPTSVFIYGGVIPIMDSTEEQVKNKIKDYGLEPWTRFIGPFMEIEILYHLSDLWIYSSSFEGLPFGPVELQASSVPTLVSDVITSDIDLGLGLVHFMSLNESPYKWAQKASHIKKQSIDKDTIMSSFIRHEFDILQSVKELENIYRYK